MLACLLACLRVSQSLVVPSHLVPWFSGEGSKLHPLEVAAFSGGSENGGRPEYIQPAPWRLVPKSVAWISWLEGERVPRAPEKH